MSRLFNRPSAGDNIATIIVGCLLLLLIVAVGLAIGSLIWGAVIYAMWNWVFLGCLAMPVFGWTGLTALTFGQSCGIGLILTSILMALKGRG